MFRFITLSWHKLNFFGNIYTILKQNYMNIVRKQGYKKDVKMKKKYYILSGFVEHTFVPF